jgi:hypothetical protein
VFTFATAKPVYPLRLTGVDNGALKVELFVLGPALARIPGFEVVDARPTAYPDLDIENRYLRWPSRLEFTVVHPGLRSLAGDAAFATRLNATLSPVQMRTDALVEWEGNTPYQQVRYSARGARLSCLQWFGGGWLACVILVSAGNRFGWWKEQRIGLKASWAFAFAGLSGALCLLWMPVVPVRMESRRGPLLAAARAEGAYASLAFVFKRGDPLPSVDSVRGAIREVLEEYPSRFLSPMREEDSPRNYIVRAVPQRCGDGLFRRLRSGTRVQHPEVHRTAAVRCRRSMHPSSTLRNHIVRCRVDCRRGWAALSGLGFRWWACPQGVALGWVGVPRWGVSGLRRSHPHNADAHLQDRGVASSPNGASYGSPGQRPGDAS